MEYSIKISYITGDSFSSELAIDFIEFTWKNIDIVKQNLLRIKEHYEQYQNIYKFNYKMKSENYLDINKNKDWFVNIPELYCISNNNTIEEKYKKKVGDGNWAYRPEHYQATKCLYIFLDDNKKVQLSAFWVGTFEQLKTIEIVVNGDDLKIEF